MTASDRELATEGIQQLSPTLTTYEALLVSIADVLGFPDLKHEPQPKQETEIRTLLSDSEGLL